MPEELGGRPFRTSLKTIFVILLPAVLKLANKADPQVFQARNFQQDEIPGQTPVWNTCRL